jgi:hypothetical protein
MQDAILQISVVSLERFFYFFLKTFLNHREIVPLGIVPCLGPQGSCEMEASTLTVNVSCDFVNVWPGLSKKAPSRSACCDEINKPRTKEFLSGLFSTFL